MKPGDLVITTSAPDEKLHDDLVGLVGVAIETVSLEDGQSFIGERNWWVLMSGQLSAWSERYLRVIDETR